MKRLQLVLILLLILSRGLSQSDWVTTKIGANVYVKFPEQSYYKLIGKVGRYSTSKNNCLFIATVSFDVIPKYGEFLKLPEKQQNEFVEVLMDNTVKGMLTQAGDQGAASKAFKIGNYSGREVSYTFLNPLTGKRSLKKTKLLYKMNAIYSIQTFSLVEEIDCKEEQDIFLNSIVIK